MYTCICPVSESVDPHAYVNIWIYACAEHECKNNVWKTTLVKIQPIATQKALGKMYVSMYACIYVCMHICMYVTGSSPKHIRLKPKAHQAQAQSTSGSSPKHIRLKPKAHQAPSIQKSLKKVCLIQAYILTYIYTSVHTYIHIHVKAVCMYLSSFWVDPHRHLFGIFRI
jgi:hypothetical protein